MCVCIKTILNETKCGRAFDQDMTLLNIAKRLFSWLRGTLETVILATHAYIGICIRVHSRGFRCLTKETFVCLYIVRVHVFADLFVIDVCFFHAPTRPGMQIASGTASPEPDSYVVQWTAPRLSGSKKVSEYRITYKKVAS